MTTLIDRTQVRILNNSKYQKNTLGARHIWSRELWNNIHNVVEIVGTSLKVVL